jgi:hypothetical protein
MSIERVSLTSDGTEADSGSFAHSISADGRFVTYMSWATNIVPGDTNGRADAFVHDRETGTVPVICLFASCTPCRDLLREKPPFAAILGQISFVHVRGKTTKWVNSEIATKYPFGRRQPLMVVAIILGLIKYLTSSLLGSTSNGLRMFGRMATS